MAVTIVISAFVSLTLTPTLAALWLKPARRSAGEHLRNAPLKFIDDVIARYGRMLDWVLARQTATLIVALATLALTVVLYLVIPKGLFPTQDTGLVQGVSVAGQSISYSGMGGLQQQVAASLLKDPDVASLTGYVGVDGTNTTLKHRPLSDQPQAARPAQLVASRHARAAAPARGGDPGHDSLPAAGAGPDHRRQRQPHPVSVLAGGAGYDDRQHLGVQDRRPAFRGSSALRNVGFRRAGPGAGSVHQHRSRHRCEAVDHAIRQSTTPSPTPSVSGSSRTSSPSPTCTA